jgi:hypothetical protein
MTSASDRGERRTHYTQPTEDTFERAVEALRRKMPDHQAALVALLVEGKFHEPDAIVAVLAGDHS